MYIILLQNLMEQYFNRMQILAKNQDLPSRIRFMLQDVIELRKDRWVPRKATNTEGPMPITQVSQIDRQSYFMFIIFFWPL